MAQTKLQRRTALAWLAAAAALPRASLAAPALDGPLTIVVPYAPGGSSDRAGRLVGERLQAKLGVNVIVENRTGAGGRIAAQQVRRATAEQNIVMVGNPATMVIAPVVFKDAGYGADDFQPISQVSEYEFGVAIGPEVPVRELSHLIAWLKANPDKANFGVPATGSLPHFFALMLGDAVQVKAQIVGYRGSGPMATDLIGGQLAVAVDSLDTLYPLHAAGKIKILAASGAKRAPFAPDVPTFREAGFGLTATGWNAFFAAKAMPAAKVQVIGAAVRDVMREDALRKSFATALMQPVVSTPAETAAMLKAYRAQWVPVVQKSGFQP